MKVILLWKVFPIKVANVLLVIGWSVCSVFFHPPGDVHGSPTPSGSGRLPPLWISGLADDSPLWHPAQAVESRCGSSCHGPAPCPLAAVRLPHFLHQQSVSHAGLLWNHRPAGGLFFPCTSPKISCLILSCKSPHTLCRASSGRMILRKWRFRCSSWCTAPALLKTKVELTSSCLMAKQRYSLSACFSDFHLLVRGFPWV